MLLTMALLAYLAYRYTYVKIQSKEDIDENENIDNNNDNNIPLEEKPSKSDWLRFNITDCVLRTT